MSSINNSPARTYAASAIDLTKKAGQKNDRDKAHHHTGQQNPAKQGHQGRTHITS
jgi:hypothetical protein